MSLIATLLEGLPDAAGAPCTLTTWLGHADDAPTRAKAAEECRGCPVVNECLLGALERRERYGVWGGIDLETAYRARYYPPRTRTEAECGTKSGYAAHRRRDEETCAECRAAMNAYNSTRRAEKRAAAKAARPAIARTKRMAARAAAQLARDEALEERRQRFLERHTA